MVQPGDTLSGIAASHGASLAAVEAANPQLANPNLIFADQSIKIPAGGSSAAGSATATEQAPVAHTYTAQAPVAHTYTSPSHASSYGSTQRTATTYTSPSSTASAAHTSTSGAGYSNGSLSSIAGVPQSFAACVAYHESTNGTNQAYNGGVYGIITASGINVNGQSVAAQKAAFAKLYSQYGSRPWAGDGCA